MMYCAQEFYILILDEVIRNMYPDKYSIVVMVMLHMICGETKSCHVNSDHVSLQLQYQPPLTNNT